MTSRNCILFTYTCVIPGFGAVCVAFVLVFCVVLSVMFVFVLCLVYPMLPVSLECPFLIAPSVFFNVYLIKTCQNFKTSTNGRLIVCCLSQTLAIIYKNMWQINYELLHIWSVLHVNDLFLNWKK